MLEEETNQYEYYNAKGKLVGQSQGAGPLDSMLEKAHYAVENAEHMIKNADTPSTIQSDIKAFRKELLSTPVSNINEIMQLNRIIEALTQYLHSMNDVNNV